MIHIKEYSSPVGPLLVTVEEERLAGLRRADPEQGSDHPSPGGADSGGSPVMERTLDWLNRYFAGEVPSAAELPLRLRGTAFQRRVWERLRDIPYGELLTYGALALELGTSPRAVGNALAQNPIWIVIPCHRVLGAKGDLTGYAGGLEMKRQLLYLEGALPIIL